MSEPEYRFVKGEGWLASKPGPRKVLSKDIKPGDKIISWVTRGGTEITNWITGDVCRNDKNRIWRVIDGHEHAFHDYPEDPELDYVKYFIVE